MVADQALYPSRAALARGLCDVFAWNNPKGDPKLMSARVMLLGMERAGLITLPAPRSRYTPRKGTALTDRSLPGDPVVGIVDDLSLSFERVATPDSSRLWNELIHRWHYLGYVPLPGAQVRYLVRHRDQVIACLGFGAAAWKVAPRDCFIGWSSEARRVNLPRVVNNARFLILPWVRIPHLASHLLARAVRHLIADWPPLYGIAPVLLETFVEASRFRGTCYKAANWIPVGRTQGRGKKDIKNQFLLPVKEIFLFPLSPRFREILSQDHTPLETP